MQGFGFFQNVGSTRRQGIEAEATLKSSKLQLTASYTFVDARFLNALQVGSNSPFADANGNIQILPGNQIPALPRNRVKARLDYSVTDAFKVGGDALFVGSQYFVGDGSNQFPKLPSYAVFNLHASYQIDKTFQIYARADNIFDNRYATYGTFFDTGALPNFANGGAPFTDPRIAQPGAAARPLRRPEGHFLNRLSARRLSPPDRRGEPGSRGPDRKPGSRRTGTRRCSRERQPAKPRPPAHTAQSE